MVVPLVETRATGGALRWSCGKKSSGWNMLNARGRGTPRGSCPVTAGGVHLQLRGGSELGTHIGESSTERCENLLI